MKDKIEYTNHILEIKFGLYEWINSKAGIMVGFNTAVLSAALFVFDKWMKAACWREWWFWWLLVSIVALIMSIILSIVIAIPIIRSRINDKHPDEVLIKSVRTVVGIRSMSPNGYFEMVKSLTEEEMLRHNTDEIVKVNYNIDRDSFDLKIVAYLTIAGIIALLAANIAHWELVGGVANGNG